jgi:hypothetical protein
MDCNDWADYWRNTIGVNVIPAVGKLKIPKYPWLKDPRGNWQVDPIPQSLHDEWKSSGAFKDGMAIICGKVLHNESKKHLYLCAVDCDNKKAIDCMTNNIEEMSKKTIIEQHANPNTAHFYVYTTTPMAKKSSDSTNSKLKELMDVNEIPAIEVKGEGQHGIMYCTPSPHKDGSNYHIIGVMEPAILDNIGEIVSKICGEYGLGVADDGKVPMKLLMDNETQIIAGHNRHEAIMRYAESILRKFPKMEKQMFEDLIMLKNNRMCKPPLNENEIQIQIECAVNFISEQIEHEEILKKFNGERFGKDEFWTNVDNFVKAFHPIGNFLKCLECNEFVEPDPFIKKHYGHKVVIDTFK